MIVVIRPCYNIGLREETLSSEHSAMRLYNGSRVHKAKYALVGDFASATGLFVWFSFWFKNDPRAS
jgi:hypothetical protein